MEARSALSRIPSCEPRTLHPTKGGSTPPLYNREPPLYNREPALVRRTSGFWDSSKLRRLDAGCTAQEPPKAAVTGNMLTRRGPLRDPTHAGDDYGNLEWDRRSTLKAPFQLEPTVVRFPWDKNESPPTALHCSSELQSFPIHMHHIDIIHIHRTMTEPVVSASPR